MNVGVLKERLSGERRVALVPAHVGSLTKLGADVLVENGAGEAAGFADEAYAEKGARPVDRATVLAEADALLTVRTAAADPDGFAQDAGSMKEGQLVIGHAEPYEPSPAFRKAAERKISLFAMELMPRITRAQSMDALSSMANLAGYKAVILAADALPKMFPMMMTAAGTIVAAKAFIVGVGVAGLQAIATAKRLGAVVTAYDIRPAVKEQVKSLGAKFIEMELETEEAEAAGGYAREMGEDFYRRQREMMREVVADQDVVITTAAVPGKKAPVLITEDMIKGMAAGSVVVDLAAERGGNCELTERGETVVKHGVTIIGPENVASTLARTASTLYSKNITTFFSALVEEGRIALNEEDEIVSSTLVTRGGEVANAELRQRLEM
ncbi:MAG: Re/Si-specific NAD(P)(+) transhydrogenase subunit alpha [Spirochaetaceae bacterium]